MASALSAHTAAPAYSEAMHVVVVDDEKRMVELVASYLGDHQVTTTAAHDGPTGLAAARQPDVDAVVLDLMLPGMSGIEVCKQLRREGNDVPVLMLTARGAVPERVAGLEAGADDYLVKPFALEELVARVRALLRRLGPDDAATKLNFADLELDTGTREVRRGDETLTLTRTEFALLELFLRNPRQVLTRSVIFDRVWGYDFGYGSNSLDVYISYLRKKTEAGGKPRLIHTVRGVGYALREP